MVGRPVGRSPDDRIDSLGAAIRLHSVARLAIMQIGRRRHHHRRRQDQRVPLERVSAPSLLISRSGEAFRGISSLDLRSNCA